MTTDIQVETYDTVAVYIDGRTIAWVDPDHSYKSAEAIVRMAIMRQGVDEKFFVVVKHGAYKDGDSYIAGSAVEFD